MLIIDIPTLILIIGFLPLIFVLTYGITMLLINYIQLSFFLTVYHWEDIKKYLQEHKGWLIFYSVLFIYYISKLFR